MQGQLQGQVQGQAQGHRDGYGDGYGHGQGTTKAQPTPASSDMSMNMFIPGAPQGNKLHGGVPNKRQERKKLYNNIRNGNFGI